MNIYRKDPFHRYYTPTLGHKLVTLLIANQGCWDPF